jgi:hypothetical protein
LLLHVIFSSVAFNTIFLSPNVSASSTCGHRLSLLRIAITGACSSDILLWLLSLMGTANLLQVQALVAARSISLDKVACDPWAIHACPREWLGRRLMQVS